MCKLFAIIDIENKDNAERYARKAFPLVTKTDNHGAGLMKLGENGVYIRRWLYMPERLTDAAYTPQMERYADALATRSPGQGTPSNRLDALAIHGRFATCERSFENVHPFAAEGTAIMHNGIISNHTQYDRKLSTCDSEALLWQYIDYEVRDNPGELVNALNGMKGYYACIVFNDNGVVDIWRDDRATLFLAYVAGVGTVIATTRDIISDAAKEAKFKMVDCEAILPFTHIRWKRGEVPAVYEFEVTKYTPSTGYIHNNNSNLLPDWRKQEIAEALAQKDAASGAEEGGTPTIVDVSKVPLEVLDGMEDEQWQQWMEQQEAADTEKFDPTFSMRNRRFLTD